MVVHAGRNHDHTLLPCAAPSRKMVGEARKLQRSCAWRCRVRCSSARTRWSSARSCSRRWPPSRPASGEPRLSLWGP